MFRVVNNLKGAGFMLWHAKHELFHIVLGLLWIWILWGAWQEMQGIWIFLSIVGSILPDLDHLLYFFTYGKKDMYTKSIFSLVKKKEWKILITFVETGHKHNTRLAFHNIYVIGLCIGITASSYQFDWKATTVIIGSMVTHYLFDIFEDIALLGRINSNWLRFGRPAKAATL